MCHCRDRGDEPGEIPETIATPARETKVTGEGDPVADFIKAACVPLDGWHAAGTLDRAEAILAAHPEGRGRSIHTAAILGDEPAVCRFLELDPDSATAKGGPRGWDALTHLCFSRYLRLDRSRSDGFFTRRRHCSTPVPARPPGGIERNHQPEPDLGKRALRRRGSRSQRGAHSPAAGARRRSQ